MEKESIDLKAEIELLESKLQQQQFLLDRLEREAQIEAALERIRSRTMAMYKSDELGETVEVLFQQLKALGINAISGWVSLVNIETRTLEFWIKHGDKPVTPVVVDESHRENFKNEIDAWERNQEYIQISLPKKETVVALKKLFDIDLVEVEEEPTFYLLHVRHQHGYLGYGAWQEAQEETRSILKRFTQVFDQTYTRFLDLQRAEALAREAHIEAALERVRSRAMAMHSSDEFCEVASMAFGQLQLLGFAPLQCFIIIINNTTHEMTWWSSSFSAGSQLESFPIKAGNRPFDQAFFDEWKQGTTYCVVELSGKLKQQWEQHLFVHSHLKLMPAEIQESIKSLETIYLSNAFMQHGVLEAISPELLSDDKAEILQRFARVIDLTYTRVEDLQQAEARAREAIQQASLDRVRGEIASMRSAEDLQRITPLVWQELTHLGVPFFRCGVFIIDEGKASVHAYLSTPEGHPLGVMDIPYGVNDITDELVTYWRRNEVYKDHWDKEQFLNWMQSMIEQRRLHSAEKYQGAASPPESLYLNFIPFKQGMLYVGNRTELSPDEINMVQTLAKAFSIAYARYDDFKQMEEAKEQIESTLTELKATQSQLIQSEKMASLGEVTAGIAHEIQNPLNFVNNISEINQELIAEMIDEIKNGNLDEVLLIAEDLDKNESKIVHYGKRADAIVKGMLQHSQRSSGKKEPTNLNALADEYLRLAYHGLRAKQKDFEAEFTTKFDESLPKVKVIPQDMGRMLLNIINNAFQEVSEKKQKEPNDYQPAVVICTRQVGSNVEISIADNGRGIPEAIRDKIFQPFFTTRPSGQGTGLGLSLAYDIVKAHGGEIKLKTNEGEGTTMFVYVPVT